MTSVTTPSAVTIRFRVNGKDRTVQVPPYRLLLDCLRNDLGLTGTKEGCAVGVCGACTVLLDGKMISSCLLLAVMADGAEITTVEGLARDGRLHPAQQAFVDCGGFQCGICTPGQVVAAKALLDENPAPGDEDIKDWMLGNLCRCTGYYQIVNSIRQAAALRAGSRKGAAAAGVRAGARRARRRAAGRPKAARQRTGRRRA
ncbi:MAG TPA: (2Fe-2S)-binding protein [Candidatus Sulfotelmatobacter sp.]|nr:(2Fe-2S)-binding protein [Candidatus Sulfotelmatobacter sp.]